MKKIKIKKKRRRRKRRRWSRRRTIYSSSLELLIKWNLLNFVSTCWYAFHVSVPVFKPPLLWTQQGNGSTRHVFCDVRHLAPTTFILNYLTLRQLGTVYSYYMSIRRVRSLYRTPELFITSLLRPMTWLNPSETLKARMKVRHRQLWLRRSLSTWPWRASLRRGTVYDQLLLLLQTSVIWPNFYAIR